MPGSKASLFLHRLRKLLRIMLFSFMIGIANVIKEESRFMEDTHYTIEYKEEIPDDEPFDPLV